MSKRHSGKSLSDFHKQQIKKSRTKKKILQYSLDGILIKEHESITDASKYSTVDVGSISKCAYSKIYRAGNFIWEFKKG